MGDEVPQEPVDRLNDNTTCVDDLPWNDASTPHNPAGARQNQRTDISLNLEHRRHSGLSSGPVAKSPIGTTRSRRTDTQRSSRVVRSTCLLDEGIDTSLIKVVHDARTPFTGVIEMELGDSIALNWRNQVEVRLDVRDVDQRSQELTNCDAVLVTFEIPRETVQQTLALVHTENDDRPMVIVTPGQPYPDETLSPHSLTHIDYLVAQAWELERYASTSQERFDPDPVARNLLAYGVETLCLLVNGGCTVYSESAHEAFLVPTFPSIYKGSSASRDAFCAALAAKLIDHDRVFSEQVALWAAAAMSCATADFPLSNSMPDRKRIEALLTRSRFTVSVR